MRRAGETTTRSTGALAAGATSHVPVPAGLVRRPTARATVLPTDAAPSEERESSATSTIATVAQEAAGSHAPLTPAERDLIALLVELALKPWMPGT